MIAHKPPHSCYFGIDYIFESIRILSRTYIETPRVVKTFACLTITLKNPVEWPKDHPKDVPLQ